MVRRETYCTTITNCNGAVEQELSYDAWGNRRDPDTWRRNWYNPALEEPMFDRGYTGHEHLYAFGLINMNGRCYDPVMSSFLSVDAYVQSPDNSQNFNRYAYCLNNPLKYIDPSGWTVIGGGMGSHTTGAAEWGTNYAPVYEPRDLYSPFARGEAAMALLTSYRVGNYFSHVVLEGGGGCSNSGDGGESWRNLKGGWIKNSNGIVWNPYVSSQKEMKENGIQGSFLGHTYTDVANQTYYSLLGYIVDMTIENGLAGKLAPLIDQAIAKLMLFDKETAAYNNYQSNSLPVHGYTDFGHIIDYDETQGFVNQHDFNIGFAICHFSVYKNPEAMLARLDHIDFSKGKDSNSGFGFVNWSDGYNIHLLSKMNQISTNPRETRTMTITFTNESSWIDFRNRYNAVYGGH